MIVWRIPGGSFGLIIIMVSALLGRKMTPNFHIILMFAWFWTILRVFAGKKKRLRPHVDFFC